MPGDYYITAATDAHNAVNNVLAAKGFNNDKMVGSGDAKLAQAVAQAEVQRQRTLLGQEYQTAINQAMAEHNYERAYALYEEAVRAENMLWQKEKYYTDLALSYLKMLL